MQLLILDLWFQFHFLILIKNLHSQPSTASAGKPKPDCLDFSRRMMIIPKGTGHRFNTNIPILAPEVEPVSFLSPAQTKLVPASPKSTSQ